MAKHVEDFKNTKGQWVQRFTIGEKYTWTTSGVLWNNIKERCTVCGHTQLRENTYIGCTNEFKDFQEFTNWHVEQIGYGLGYQLDADILKGATKKYSKETCVLIPPPLNKFLQSYCNERVHLPQGISLHRGRLYARINNRGVRSTLGAFKPDDMQKAVDLYTEAKTSAGKDWYNDLVSGKYTVDPLVIEFMKNWRYVCDWKPNGQI